MDSLLAMALKKSTCTIYSTICVEYLNPLVGGYFPEALTVCMMRGACSSEFLELESVPTASHLEGPLERGPIASATLPEINQDEPLERFFVCHLHPNLGC